MPQDFLSLGIDVAGFNAQKQQLLSSAIEMFDILDAYSKKVYNPILGTGLAEFNTSISSTSKLLDELNEKLSLFTQSANTSNTATSSAARGVKELTTEQATAIVQTRELNKLKIKEAENQNLLTQSRINAKSAIKAQFDVETAESKQQISDSALIQKMIKQEAIEEENLSSHQIKDSKTIEQLKSNQITSSNNLTKAKQQEDAANKILRDDYLLLTQVLREQATIYSNLYINAGKNDPKTKEALQEYTTTATTINEINSNLVAARKPAQELDDQLVAQNKSAISFGHGLKSIYNQLRIIAYILPGVGIAGIFNFAFQAISQLLSSLVDLDSNFEAEEERIKSINKALQDQLGIINNIVDKSDSLAKLDPFSKTHLNEQITINQKKGENADVIALQDIKIAQDKLNESTSKYKDAFGDKKEIDVKKELEDRYDDIVKLSARQSDLNAVTEKFNDIANKIKKGGTKDLSPGDLEFFYKNESNNPLKPYDITGRIPAEQDAISSQIKTANDKFSLLQKITSEYYSSTNELSTKQAENEKRIRETTDKEIEEYEKGLISLNEKTNELILSNDKYTEQQKLNALKKLRDDSNALFLIDKNKVLNNPESTPADIATAKNKYDIDTAKAQKDYLDKDAKLREEYRQERLTADEKVATNNLQQVVDSNEKIFSNDKESLSNRLLAYVTFIKSKKQIDDIEYKREIDILKLKTGDPTAQKQIAALESNRQTAIVQENADAQEKIYNIVYTSGQRQLKSIEDRYKEENNYSKQQLVDDLTDNNTKYDNREESYKKWLDTKKKLELEDKTIEYNKDEESVRSEIGNLLQLQIERTRDLANAEVQLTQAKLEGNHVDIERATGNYNAKLQLSIDTTKKLTAAQKELLDILLKIAELGREKPLNEWFKYLSEIEKVLYENVKKFIDAGYQYRLDILAKNKQIVDEQYGYEISAIQKSSLTAKDKAALDIQVAEQKREYDKKAQADERRIKVEQATFDKKLAIAHIIFGTAAAIIEGVPPSPKSIAAGIIGGIELAAAIATPIPAFKEGTKGKPFVGGVARYGEIPEVVKEPYRSPYLVMTETVSYLPKGTEIIPVKESPVFDTLKPVDDWDKFIWLAKQMKKNVPQKGNITNVIRIDLGFETYKKSILGNG